MDTRILNQLAEACGEEFALVHGDLGRLEQAVGAVSVKQQEQELERFRIHREIPRSQVQPQRLYVGVDGTTVQEQDSWHEAKTGCIYCYDEQLPFPMGAMG